MVADRVQTELLQLQLAIVGEDDNWEPSNLQRALVSSARVSTLTRAAGRLQRDGTRRSPLRDHDLTVLGLMPFVEVSLSSHPFRLLGNSKAREARGPFVSGVDYKASTLASWQRNHLPRWHSAGQYPAKEGPLTCQNGRKTLSQVEKKAIEWR